MPPNTPNDAPTDKPTDDQPADTQPVAPEYQSPQVSADTIPPPVDSTSVTNSATIGAGGAKRKIPTLLLLVGLAVLLIGGGVAAYLSTVSANKPENIWARALENTNKGYATFVDYARTNQDNKGVKLDGTFKVNADSVVVDGTITARSYERDAEATIDIGAAGTRVNLNLLSHVPENSQYPDIYLKANGLQGIGQMLGGEATEVGGFLTAFDNQWFAVDHTLFEQLANSSGATDPAAAANITPEDTYTILDTIGRVNAEYLFTENLDKAVLRVAENVGKEKLDERDVYHYKVGYSKENLKKYATAMKDELNKTKVKDLVPEKNLEQALNFESLLQEIDKLDGNGTADVWVDLDTKLIRKVRFSEKDKPENYVDLTLNYNGGDEYPFVIAMHDKDGSMEVDFTTGIKVNIKQNTVNYTLDVRGTGENPFTATVNLNLSQSDEKIEFKKPDGAKSLSDLLGGLLGGQLPITTDPNAIDGLEGLQL